MFFVVVVSKCRRATGIRRVCPSFFIDCVPHTSCQPDGGGAERKNDGRVPISCYDRRLFEKGTIFAMCGSMSPESKMKRLFGYIVFAAVLAVVLWRSGGPDASSAACADTDAVRSESLCEECGLHDWYCLVADSWRSDVPPAVSGTCVPQAEATSRPCTRNWYVVQTVPSYAVPPECPAVRLCVQRCGTDRMRAELARSGHYVLALRKIIV